MVGGYINPYRWVSDYQVGSGANKGTYKYVRRNSGVNSLSKATTSLNISSVASCSENSSPCEVYPPYSKKNIAFKPTSASSVCNSSYRMMKRRSFVQNNYSRVFTRGSVPSCVYTASRNTLYKYIKKKSEVLSDTTSIFNEGVQTVNADTQTGLISLSRRFSTSKDGIRKLQKKSIVNIPKSRFKYFKQNHESGSLNICNSEHIEVVTTIGIKKSRLASSHVSGTACVKKNVHRSIMLLKYKRKPVCQVYSRTGKCPSKNNCRFLHDANYLRICPRYLQHSCKLGSDACPFAHVLDPCRIPQCTFYEEGKCERSDCPYLHTNHPPKTPVCPDFARGRCARGRSCTKRHIWASNTLHKKVGDRKLTIDDSATGQLVDLGESGIKLKEKSIHFPSTEVPQGSLRHVFPAPEFIPLNLDK